MPDFNIPDDCEMCARCGQVIGSGQHAFGCRKQRGRRRVDADEIKELAMLEDDPPEDDFLGLIDRENDRVIRRCGL
jgi:hypothetical protein